MSIEDTIINALGKQLPEWYEHGCPSPYLNLGTAARIAAAAVRESEEWRALEACRDALDWIVGNELPGAAWPAAREVLARASQGDRA